MNKKNDGIKQFSVNVSDEDIFEAMKDVRGYIDITPGDLRTLYGHAYEHALGRILKSHVADEIMTREVVSVKDGDKLSDVAHIMAQHAVSGVPVIDNRNRVCGIISEKDIIRIMGGGKASGFLDVLANCLHGDFCLAAPSRELTAKEVMSSPAITVNPKTPVAQITALFREKNINRVPVIDESERLIGLVSRSDILDFYPGLK